VVLRFNNGSPAILERRLGQGRVLTMTTPVTDAAGVRATQPWNLLPTGVEPWPYFVLANEAALHLANSHATKLNYVAGATAHVPAESGQTPRPWQLFTPAGHWQEVAARDGAIAIGFTEAPGAYRLRPPQGAAPRGFSVNLPEDAGDLSRAPRERLDEALGKEHYRYAENWETFTREIHQGRAGREFFPLLAALLALALGMEHLLANRFYKRSGATE
jgi:hypothetical protein